MKKKLLILSVILLVICASALIFIGCNHTCVFTLKDTSSSHLKSEATCSSRATYFYSCSCGKNGTKTFLSGDFEDHVFTYYEYDDNATCTSNATETATCDNECGAKDVRVVENTQIAHLYTNYIYNYDATFESNGTKTATCDYGCGNESTIDVIGSILIKPVYETDDYIPIIAYSTPTNANWDGSCGNLEGITYSVYRDIKDAGFTGLQPLREGYLLTGGDLTAWNKKANADALKALEICEQLGLDYYVHCWQFSAAYNNSLWKKENQKGLSDEQVVEKMLGNFTCVDHPNFAGHYLYDEPDITNMTRLVPIVRKYKEILPNADPFFNLLPSYATHAQLGGTYQEYIDYYCEKIAPLLGYICYDFYPYSASANTTTIMKDYLYNFQVVAEKAKDLDIEFRFYIQAGDVYATSRNIGIEEFRHQMYTAMAFGVRYFIYYTYGWGGNSNYLIDANLMPTSRYYAAKKVNKEVHLLEDIILSFDWQSVMYQNVDEDNPNVAFEYLDGFKDVVNSHPKINNYSVTQDSIVGCFKDKDGHDGFMFVNYSEPGRKLSDDITVNFNDTSLLLVYEKGVEKIVYGNTYTFTLEPGEGRFVIPLN